MDLLKKLCDPVIVMAEGSVLFEGKFEEVKSNEECYRSLFRKRNES